MTVDHPAPRPIRPAARAGGLPPRLGAGAHDQQHRLEVLAPISAPDGLGVVAEYRAAVGLSDRPLKMTLPGPFTLSGRLWAGPGGAFGSRRWCSSSITGSWRGSIWSVSCRSPAATWR